MDAIFLVCGAGGPQLKRNPLGSGSHILATRAILHGMKPDPHHPLFHGLAQAEVRSLKFVRGSSGRDASVELVLRAEGTERAFKFDGVPWLRLSDGFPEIGWLQVHDVSERQLDGLHIHVSDGEQDDAIEFWAAGVKEIDVPAA